MFPNHVFKLKNALYGSKQALRACYDRLSSYLVENLFVKESVDTTLFIMKRLDDILLV